MPLPRYLVFPFTRYLALSFTRYQAFSVGFYVCMYVYVYCLQVLSMSSFFHQTRVTRFYLGRTRALLKNPTALNTGSQKRADGITPSIVLGRLGRRDLPKTLFHQRARTPLVLFLTVFYKETLGAGKMNNATLPFRHFFCFTGTGSVPHIIMMLVC